MKRALVTLLSDFGTSDGFAAAMKGVIFGLAPEAQVVDLTHDIPPQDIRAGAWSLREAVPYFPSGTIHLAVVDPGVGSSRRPLLLHCDGQFLVGPDNGLLTLAAQGDTRGWVLDKPGFRRDIVSSTFHGRDLFAPAAGYLAAGVRPADLGTPVTTWETLSLPEARRLGDRIEGRVVHVDRFGNIISNISAELLDDPAGFRVQYRGRLIGPLSRTFADVRPGAWVAYIGSSGLMELAIRDGRAASQRVDEDLGSEVICMRMAGASEGIP